MKEFTVFVREVYVQPYKITAETEGHAKKLVAEGEGETIDGFEYSHTLDPEMWTVERRQSHGGGFFA